MLEEKVIDARKIKTEIFNGNFLIDLNRISDCRSSNFYWDVK